MQFQEELELKLFDKDISEHDHYSNILNNMRFRGWYRFEIKQDFYLHTFCIFRIPPAIPLYDNVLKKFSIQERKAGLHRLLAGKELREEMDHLRAQFNGDISECLSSLEDSEVTELLGRLQKIVTFDCNKIPYLHVKTIEGDTTEKVDILSEVKKHMLSLPNYLDIFYDVLNEVISLKEAEKISGGIIYNEYLSDLLNKHKEVN